MIRRLIRVTKKSNEKPKTLTLESAFVFSIQSTSLLGRFPTKFFLNAVTVKRLGTFSVGFGFVAVHRAIWQITPRTSILGKVLFTSKNTFVKIF